MDSEQIMETLKSIQGNMATKEDIRLLNDGNKKLQDDVNEIKANFKQKVSDLEEKMEGLSRKMEANFNANRARNILIFKVEESLDADENIYVKIKDIFTQVGLVINDRSFVVKQFSFGYGAKKTNKSMSPRKFVVVCVTFVKSRGNLLLLFSIPPPLLLTLSKRKQVVHFINYYYYCILRNYLLFKRIYYFYVIL